MALRLKSAVVGFCFFVLAGCGIIPLNQPGMLYNNGYYGAGYAQPGYAPTNPMAAQGYPMTTPPLTAQEAQQIEAAAVGFERYY